MKVVCPTCNAVYNIQDDKVPPGRRASATCKRCGGRIVIATRAEEIESEEFTFDTVYGQELKEGWPPELGKMNVLLLIFLTVITFGIYYPVWFLKRQKAINSLKSEEKLGSGVFIFALVAYSVTVLTALIVGLMEGYTGEKLLGGGIDAFVSILNLVVGIVLLVKCFKIRRVFQDHFEQSLSALATFFFQIYYLQYKINRFY